jgi:hypothetical protein
MSDKLQEIMEKRKQHIQKDGNKVLEAYGCEKTGGGVVLGESQWSPNRDVKAFYFKPRAHRRYFKTEKVTSHHERLAIQDRVAKLLQDEKDAKVAPHDLKVGEILACIWGYSMQGVKFYKVVDIPHPRKVTVCPMEYRYVKGDWMSGTVEPVQDGPPSEERYTFMVDMSSGEPYCKTGSSIDRMTRWSGDPVHTYCD